MPDREKVISGLEEIANDKWMKIHADWYVSVCSDALALLKEQETATFKPHYIDEYGKHFICGVECGSCHKEISSTYHYCPYCGKVVMWE